MLTILPLILTTYFQLKFLKLCLTKYRTKNWSSLADRKYVKEVSTATTEPDMTFLFVYFGLIHPLRFEVMFLAHGESEGEIVVLVAMVIFLPHMRK